MTRRLPTFALLAFAAAFALSLAQPQKAEAAFGQVLCAPDATANTRNRTIGGTGSAVPSGTLYVLNGQGCAFIGQADVGYFLSQGYNGGQNSFSIAQTGIIAQDFTSLTLPAGAYVNGIVIRETSGAAVTGGIKIGTTAGGTDVVAAATCGSGCLISVTDVSLLKRVFSATATQKLSVDAVSSFNGAALSITVLYSLF